MVTISQTSATLGTILSANNTALRMFGYTKRDFIGQNVNCTIPEPIASVHQQFLVSYMTSGHEVRIPFPILSRVLP